MTSMAADGGGGDGAPPDGAAHVAHVAGALWPWRAARARLGDLAASASNQLHEFLRPEMLLQSGDLDGSLRTSTRHAQILRLLQPGGDGRRSDR